jgi:hypothetical protein
VTSARALKFKGVKADAAIRTRNIFIAILPILIAASAAHFFSDAPPVRMILPRVA